MQRKAAFLFLFILVHVWTSSRAQHIVVELEDASPEYRHIGKSMYLFEDKKRNYDIEEILKNENLFTPSTLEAPNFGTTSSHIWSMVDVMINSKSSWFFEFDAPWLDTLIVYYPQNGKYSSVFLGRRLPLKNQPHAPDLIFKISPEDFPRDSVLRFYFRAKSNDQFLKQVWKGSWFH